MSTSFIRAGFLDGMYHVTRDGEELDAYVEYEHALANAVSHYLLQRRAVKVYTNLVMDTVIEDLGPLEP